MNDKEIIEAVLGGRNEAFGTLVERYSAKIYRLCLSLCGNRADAEDAVQEAFIDAFRYLVSLSDREKFYPWLCAIARRKAFRQIRMRRTDADIDGMAEFLSTETETAADEAIRAEKRERVAHALGKLSDKRRTVCELYYFRNMKIGEIAKKLSLSENTVKSRLFDSKEFLRKELSDMNENQETITALEKKIKEQIKKLSYYYSLNGGKYDDKYDEEVREAIGLAEKIGDEKTKQYYLSDLLNYQSRNEPDDGRRNELLEKRDRAAETGENVRVIANKLIDEILNKNDYGKMLKIIDETALPKIKEYEDSPGYGYANGALRFWRGRALIKLGRLDEARRDFETAAGSIEKSDAYQANAVAAIRAIDNMRDRTSEPMKGCEVTAEGFLFENGRLFFHNQPGFSEDIPEIGGILNHNGFVFYTAVNRIVFDTNMKPGDVLTGEDGATLECVSYGETVTVAAGRFENCMHTRTVNKPSWGDPYVMDVWYALGVGPVKVRVNSAAVENYGLCGYTVKGGDGYYPFAVGNRWVYRNPDAPSYIYHDIERTVEYTDGYLTNLAVTSPVALVKDYESCDDLDSSVYLSSAEALCNDWKITEAIGLLKKAVRLNVNEEAVRSSLFAIEVLSRFADYQKKGYRFCPSSIGAASLEVGKTGVKYQNFCIRSFGPCRFGARGRYEDRIFGLKPFRFIHQFMGCLWDEKWVIGYREEKPVMDGLTLVFTVEDGGTVTVPAGTFDNCRKITMNIDRPEGTGENWYFDNWYEYIGAGLKEYWFAPGVGIVKSASTWGEKCYAECLLEKYDVPAAKEDEYLPMQIGSAWEYLEPHLTEEGYRAKAIFRIPSGMNGRYLMTSSQEFVCFRTEEEYNKFVQESHLF
ncbi:MAG: RNA polymerase sigma factor [Lachnospiraceae bacterium]|nr:RNA polymerase sigma factor [Lachnospiraceae bacterium]